MYLESKKYGSATVKNYLADLKNFLTWNTDTPITAVKADRIEIYLGSLLAESSIQKYISASRASGKPTASINRSLSSLRKFSSFCISQGWLTSNSAKHVENIGKKPGFIDIQEALIASFQKELVRQKVSNSSLKNYLMDAREYVHITSSLT